MLEPKKYPLFLQGGVDINPKLYGEEPIRQTQSPHDMRDEREINNTMKAFEEGRPVIGICRGAQLLCVLNGGSLYQHTPDHLCNHPVTTIDGETFYNVAAAHHQVMRPKGKYKVYAYDGRSSKCYDGNNKEHIVERVPEVVWWEDTKSLGIQSHPEWMEYNHPFKRWLSKLTHELLGIEGVF